MTVYLVGAGPGDPGLITMRADEVLRRADVVVYDRLSVEALLDLAPPAAERISVGKAPGQVTMRQGDINALLVERAQFLTSVLQGIDPSTAARDVGLTASRFRFLANHDPSFARFIGTDLSVVIGWQATRHINVSAGYTLFRGPFHSLERWRG